MIESILFCTMVEDTRRHKKTLEDIVEFLFFLLKLQMLQVEDIE